MLGVVVGPCELQNKSSSLNKFEYCQHQLLCTPRWGSDHIEEKSAIYSIKNNIDSLYAFTPLRLLSLGRSQDPVDRRFSQAELLGDVGFGKAQFSQS